MSLMVVCLFKTLYLLFLSSSINETTFLLLLLLACFLYEVHSSLNMVSEIFVDAEMGSVFIILNY